jgi:hypothetical protein
MMNWTRTAICLAGLLLGVSGVLAQSGPDGSPPGKVPLSDSSAVAADTLATVASADSALPMPLAAHPRVLKSGCEAAASRRMILEMASASIGEAFPASPGAYVLRQGWHGMPQYLRLRGGGADEVVYLLDGVPLSDNQIEVQDLSRLPLAGVEKAEIFKGGLSSILGSGAIAGVLEVTSLTAMPEVPESGVTAWWGSHAGQAVSVVFSRRVTERLGVLGTYDNLTSGGWIENTSSESERFSGKVTCLLGGTTQIDVAGYRYKGDFEWPDSCPTLGATSAADRGNAKDFLRLALHTGESRKFHVDIYHLAATESFSSREEDYVNEGTLNGAELGMACHAPDSSVTSWGAGYKSNRIESTSLGNRVSGRIYAYGSREQRWARWKIQGSLRLAKNSAFDAQAGLGLAARYALRQHVCLFGRLDRSYGFPGFRVLYAGGPGESRDSRIGAETSMGVELGADVLKGPVFLSVCVFGRLARGLARIRTDDSCRTYVDPDIDIDTMGSEACVGLRLEPWLEGQVSYSIWKAEDGQGRRPAYLPEQMLTARARLRKRMSGHVSVGLTLAEWYVSAVDAGARLEPCGGSPVCLPEAGLPGYTDSLINAYLDIDRATVFVKVHNITNAVVRSGWGRVSLPSRSYEFGISVILVD